MNTPADRPRQILWENVLTVVCAAILIGAEVFGMAYASGWAFAILLGLDSNGAYALQALFFACGIYAMYRFIGAARRVEPFTTS
jgi:hypothetical protein